MRPTLEAASFSWLVMRFPILLPDFRRNFGEMTLGLYLLRITAGVGVRVRAGSHQNIDLPPVAP